MTDEKFWENIIIALEFTLENYPSEDEDDDTIREEFRETLVKVCEG